MDPAERKLLVEALQFALDAHGYQRRKGKDVPYVSHLLHVAGYVLEYGGDAELAAAALLHDALEDSPDVSVEAIRQGFGDRVTRVVEECSDLLDGDTPENRSPWKERKLAYLDHLRSASRDAQLVSGCDKLHNLANLLADIRAEGPEVLGRFNASPPETLWYYESVRDVAAHGLPDALTGELDIHLAELRKIVVVD